MNLTWKQSPCFTHGAWQLKSSIIFYSLSFYLWLGALVREKFLDDCFFTAASLVLSEWGWRHKTDAKFYLAPTRAWEFSLAGSICAFITQKRGIEKHNVLALLGFAAIVFSIFAFDGSIPFPSVYTLVPVTGAVLLILYASGETLAAKLLSTKSMVGIGLISYSLYLWHQPLPIYED